MIYLLIVLAAIVVVFALIPGGLRWLAFLVPHLIVKIASWLLAYVAVRWFSSDDKLTLKFPFGWMMTKDAGLDGDSYWKVQNAGQDMLSDALRVAWLRRNGGHAVNYGLFGVDVSAAWLDQYRSTYNGLISGGPLWETDDAFCLRWQKFGFELDAGWNLLGPIDGRAKYWIQLRKAKPLNPNGG